MLFSNVIIDQLHYIMQNYIIYIIFLIYPVYQTIIKFFYISFHPFLNNGFQNIGYGKVFFKRNVCNYIQYNILELLLKRWIF